jgi:hypothetical protein
LRPTRVPLGAFVGGWVVGGSLRGLSERQSVVDEHVSGEVSRNVAAPVLINS